MYALALVHDPLVAMGPFLVPVAGCAMVLGIVIAGVWSSTRTREIQSKERLAAIAAGVPIPPTTEELAIMHGKPQSDKQRRRDNRRSAGIILLACGLGEIAFFIALAAVLRERNVLCGAAVGFIPLVIGLGFLIDAHIQTREIEAASAEATPPPYSPYSPSL